MATRLYLRDLTATDPPSTGEKSTALPVGTFKGNSGVGFEDLSLRTTKGAAQISKALTSLAQTAHQDNYTARFTSPALAAQTIAAATWTLALAVSEGNTNANSFFAVSIYVWRPSTQAVVGYIYDTDTHLGVEWATTEDGQVFTIAGSAVTALANDVLVFEFWRGAAQAMATAYTQTLYFEGTTDVTNTTTADAASYLETTQNLSWPATQIAVTDSLGLATPAPGIIARFTLTEALGVADAFPSGTPKAFLTQTDALALADNVPSVKVSFTLAEALALSEVVGVNVSLLLSDTLTLADAVSVYTGMVQKLVQDTLALSEALSLTARFSVPDTLQLTETPLAKAFLTLAETLALTETVLPRVYTAIADTLGLTDALASIKASLSVAEALALADATPTVKAYLALVEALSLTDITPAILSKLSLSETLALADTIGAVKVALSLSETLSLADVISVSTGLVQKLVADGLTLTEAMEIWITLSPAELRKGKLAPPGS